MKRFTVPILIVAALLLALAPAGFGQTAPTISTTAAAFTATATTFTITSTTGMTTVTAPGVTPYILVDSEQMRLLSVPVAGTVTVARDPTTAVPHLSGAYAIYGVGTGTSWNARATGSPTYGTFLIANTRPTGSCTRSVQQYSPIFNSTLARSYDCLGGQWVEGNLPNSQPKPARACNVANTGAAYFVNGTLTTASFSLGVSTVPGTSGNMYISSIYIPSTRLLTGISVMNGTVVGTSLTLVDLMDATGTVLAKSSTAGISGGTILTPWDIPFGTAIMVVGPARYNFGASSVGGTGAFLLMGAAGALGDVAGRMTAGTFGTLPALTITTAFTSAQVPEGCGY